MPTAKPGEREEARRLRRELGLPMKQIAARLKVSPASVHAWTHHIELAAEQRDRNRRLAGIRRGRRWSELNRERRIAYQLEGRDRARAGDSRHQAGCMLYWAEGGKDRGLVSFTNSDRAMIGYFWRFLRENFVFDPGRVRMRLNVYLTNGLTLPEIERWWNEELRLPPACLGSHVTDHYPTSSSGRKRNKLPHGVCTLRLYETRIVQHIYGAIQEYGGFEEPRWLDGPPRRR